MTQAKRKAFLVHALSPLHAGTGHSADLIDLPTARMKGTNIPYVPGSSIKGVLRDHCSPDPDVPKSSEKWWPLWATFGPETDNAGEHAGALVVGDARVLALPVRSFIGTFAWVSSPLLLRLAERDLEWGMPLIELDNEKRGALYSRKGCCCLHEKKIYLEDLDLEATSEAKVDRWADALGELVAPGYARAFTSRFVVVDDETMAFLLETATQVDARVRLDSKTRTVANGALWLEESLPSETLLVGLMFADRSRREKHAMAPERVLDFALGGEAVIQLGGKASVGRGRCRLVPLPSHSASPAKQAR